MTGGSGQDVAAALVRGLVARGESVATAESLTGGLLCGALTGVPGASGTVRGGVVAYAVPVKERVLGVVLNRARAGAGSDYKYHSYYQASPGPTPSA